MVLVCGSNGGIADFESELTAWDDPCHTEQLRATLRQIHGPCVLDVCEENILSYACGDWALVERDLRCVFSRPLAEQLEECIRDEVQDCLAVRRELINYKKLCLHLWQAGQTVEKDLRQLASFFYCDMVSDSPPPERRARYIELSNTLNECRGAVKSIHDARYFGKAICNLPRHPASGVPWQFEELPESLEVWKPLAQAREFVMNRDALDAYWSEKWDRNRAGEHGGIALSEQMKDGENQPGTAKPMRQPRPWRSERDLVSSALSDAGLSALLAAIGSSGLLLPESALSFVKLVLIARGATKALSIRQALGRYSLALQSATAGVRSVQAELRSLLDAPTTETAVSAGLHLHTEKHWRTMTGIMRTLPPLVEWLEPIAQLQRGANRIFVSGARGAAAFVPRGFPDLLQPYRAVVAKHRNAMLEEFSEQSWPRYSRPKPQEETHFHTCRVCKNRYTKLWLHRELCFGCEAALRSEGRCPYNDKCGVRSFCPHERRCIVCEQWSCDKCRLLRGDGEDVWQLVGSMQPAAIFLDFDRTLCTTKRGNSPLQGNHSVDPDLAAVCTGYGHVQIVTRSSQKEDIEAFLSTRDVPVLAVHCVKRLGAKNKAAIIASELVALQQSGDERAGIFVDDDIRELTDPDLQQLVDEGRLQRLLFVRAGGKE